MKYLFFYSTVVFSINIMHNFALKLESQNEHIHRPSYENTRKFTKTDSK